MKMSKEDLIAKAQVEMDEKQEKEEPKVEKKKKNARKGNEKTNKKETKEVKNQEQNETKGSEQKEENIITVKDLEQEFGLKDKVIRRHLRAMEENTKPRGPERYQWKPDSKELAAIRKKLEQVIQKKQPR